MFHVKHPPTPDVRRGGCSRRTGCRWPSGTPSCWRPRAWSAGLIGPREVPRLWDRHLLNCALLGRADRRTARRCATSAPAPGCPGLVLAIARPDLRVTLVEPLLRRTTFLEEVRRPSSAWTTSRWSAAGPRSCTARAPFDVVTSRAVAPLARLLGWSMPLVAPTGALVAMKGVVGRRGDRGGRGRRSARWRCAAPEVARRSVRTAGRPPTTVVRVAWADPARVGWPPATTRRSRRRRRRRTRPR